MVKPNVASSSLLMEAAKERLRANIDRRYEHSRYRTSNAYIESVSRDTYGRSVSATVTVDGVSGYSMKTYGADIGVGERVEVENVSGEEAAPFYQLVGVMPGTATETRRIAGNSYDGLDLLNLAALRVQQDGYIVVGGAIDGNGNPQGDRVELRRYGVLGYATGGNQLSFGLFTGDYTWEEEGGTEWKFNRGDIHLGLLSSGHLLIDNPEGKLKWMVGDKEVFESRFWNGNPITTLQGWLWVGPYDDSAPGISIGREPGDTAFLFRMYNKFGVPLINFAAGTPDDPYEAYVRIGPPKPFPGLTIDTDDDGNPRMTLDGGTIIAGTMRADSFESNTLPGTALQDLSVGGSKIAYKAITADKIQVGHLSAIAADMGLLTAGEIRVGTGTVGSDFTGLRLYHVGSGLYSLTGYSNNVEQAKFDTSGRIVAGAGNVTLDADGMSIVTEFDDSPNAVKWYYEYNDDLIARIIATRGFYPTLYIAAYPDADAISSEVYIFAEDTVGDEGHIIVTPHTIAMLSQNMTVELSSLGTSLTYASSATNSVEDVLSIIHNTSGTAASGLGARIVFGLESDTSPNQNAAAMDALWTTATHASRTATLRWLLVNNGAALAEYMRLTPTQLEVTGNVSASDDVVAGKFLKVTAGSVLTISSGAITVTGSMHFVDTEGAAASDDLDTINGGEAGAFLILRLNTSAHDVVLKDSTGNLRLAGDFTMTHVQDMVLLWSNGTDWFEISRSDNSA